MKPTSVTQAYQGAPFLQRALVWARPAICPFDPLIEAVPVGSDVLDVGCGTGMFLISLAVAGRVGTGLGRDINGPAIGAAQIASRNFDEIRFEKALGPDDWPDRQFDVVSAIDVLHHIPPGFQETFFKKLISCVRPGGLFLYKDMADKPAFCAGVNRLHDLVLAKQWIHYLPLEKALRWGQEEGLVEAKVSCYRALAYAHEMVVFKKP